VTVYLSILWYRCWNSSNSIPIYFVEIGIWFDCARLGAGGVDFGF